MEITIVEKFNTVGWNEAVNQAPAQAVNVAKTLANTGQMVCFAKKIANQDRPANNEGWAVLGHVGAADGVYVAWRQNDETKPT